MRQHEVLLGVLLANDNSYSHAVAIHDNFVIDANEAIALPLCAEVLNYCTSTAHVKSEFVRFNCGFRFHYKGKKKTKLEQTWIPLSLQGEEEDQARTNDLGTHRLKDDGTKAIGTLLMMCTILLKTNSFFRSATGLMNSAGHR